ncbi:hypothetical protein DRW03_16675 [Corallococcus sp. H22C18031201]|uniref:hypothetical protein n=1 Tax=Citreicoccus inhibens TaxID=2849499 RepID=UPI000E751D79|nr:hypothetical protein [Citreicoccus inhibens]MBU8896743.1 hypothetical protein [Citreicoccus inhibens]RJS21956.1 hypothetical protein DRW03_16675 [Corallococcus sp. H22C18031201]
MVTVELDIFSGRPNPRWTLSRKEANALAERVRADPSLLLPMDADTGGLGYRGFILTVQDTPAAEGWMRAGLPSRVRLGGRFQPGAMESSAFLLHTAEHSRLDLRDPGEVLGVAEEGITMSSEVQGLYAACATSYYTTDTDFSFWNASAYLTYNNCYNYASNSRTNTFAQPGRASGSMYSAMTCANVGAAATRDGWQTACRADNNLNVCLVIWPNTDYHWYRLAVNGHWCHKPGQTAARNYDNSLNWITNPETCDRGGYTTFCGYYRGFNLTVS